MFQNPKNMALLLAVLYGANWRGSWAVHILAQLEHSFWINLNTYSELT